MLKISKDEFELYKSKAQGDDTKLILESDSMDNISKLQGELAIYKARIGTWLAHVRNEIRDRLIELTNEVKDKKPMAMNRAEPLAEQEIDNKNKISRRELDYLREDIQTLVIACSSRIKAIQGESFDAGKESSGEDIGF